MCLTAKSSDPKVHGAVRFPPLDRPWRGLPINFLLSGRRLARGRMAAGGAAALGPVTFF